jgi:hypothetical protein
MGKVPVNKRAPRESYSQTWKNSLGRKWFSREGRNHMTRKQAI